MGAVLQLLIHASFQRELGSFTIVDVHLSGNPDPIPPCKLDKTGRPVINQLDRVMKAVGLMSFGPPEVVHVVELPEPQPSPGRVIVEVLAATVNPTDCLLRSGQLASSMSHLAPPFVPGMEFAGRVLSPGDERHALGEGDVVMGVVNPRRAEGGAQAKRLSVPVQSLVAVPAMMGPHDAATLPMNGLTALKIVEALSLDTDEPILVTGGAGALGGYVIQLARNAGLRVIADAKDRDFELLKRLGAAEVVPRGPGMLAAVRTLAPTGVAALVDAAMIGNSAFQLVRDGGMCVSVRGRQRFDDSRVQHKAVSVTQHMADRDALAEVGRLAASGALTPRVSSYMPMEEAAEAHRLVERGGLRGRIVLTF